MSKRIITPVNSICAALVILCLIVVSLFWIFKEPVTSPTTEVKPKVQIPEELAALGEDPDGDGVTTAEELQQGSNPLVADVPTVSFSFDRVEVGLKIDATKSDAWDQVRIQSVETQQINQISTVDANDHVRSYHNTVTAYRGTGKLGVGGSLLPFGYAGFHSNQTNETLSSHRTSYTVHTDDLKKITAKLQEYRNKKEVYKIGPEAGYFKGVFKINSSHPCQLDDFSVNIKVNNRLFRTVPATSDKNFKPLTLHGAKSAPEILLLKLEGFNTNEMTEQLFAQTDGELAISFEVPSTTVRLGEFVDPALFRKKLTTVQSRCAIVEIVQGDRSVRYFVSVASPDNNYSLPLGSFLKRIPDAGTVEWGSSNGMQFLQRFANKGGVPYLFPEAKRDGKWVLTHQGAEVDLDHSNRVVKAGDYVKLQYVSAREYWGNITETKGYAGQVAELSRLGEVEKRFWSELSSLAPEKEFTALAQQRIQEQAKELLKLYQSFFGKDLATAIRLRYPGAKAAIEEFDRWFCRSTLGFPNYQMTLKSAKVWWNVNRELNPALVVKCGNKEVKLTKFVLDSEKRSGHLMPDSDQTFTWKPFEDVELKVYHRQLLGESLLVHCRYKGMAAVGGVLGEHSLDKLQDANQSMCGIQLDWEIKLGDKEVFPRAFEEHLESKTPRVVPLVPTTQLDPELLALSYWVLHHPVTYSRSGVIYEELYKNQKGTEEELGHLSRSMVAYFRSFQYGKCAELVKDLPSEQAKSVKGLENLPPGMTLQDLRTLGKVCELLHSVGRSDSMNNLTVQCSLTWQGCMRLKYLLRDQNRWGEWTKEDLRHWHDGLTKRLRADKTACLQVKDKMVRTFLETNIGRWERELPLLLPALK